MSVLGHVLEKTSDKCGPDELRRLKEESDRGWKDVMVRAIYELYSLKGL